ncbi:MAG: hypothetical protein ACPKM0_09765 [Pleomorphochaeta sp.]
MINKITIDKKLIENSEIKDITYVIKKAIESSNKENIYISFKKDTYIFKNKYSTQKYHFVTNNDHGIQDIAFSISDMKNITIDGNGSLFIFEGRISPFFIEHSQNIIIKNLSIDYKRAMYTQGKIIKATNSYIHIEIDREEYPYHIEGDNHIVFSGVNYESDWCWGMLEFDSKSMAPIDNAVDYFIKDKIYGKEITKNILQIDYPFKQICTLNNILVVKHEQRFVQAITIDRSKNISLENINVYHCGAMAVTAQFSENLDITKFNVIKNIEKQRVVSANADAIHCVGCKGLIKITNCIFENQMDDALNVHGNYLLIDKIINNNTIITKIGHFQHFGIFEYEKGAKLEISNRKTLLKEAIVTLKDKEIINNQYIKLIFNEDYQFSENIDYCIDNLDNFPSLIFKKNVVQKNRARGILLKTRKDVLIEDNIINAIGAAFQICCDMNFWFESGGSNNIVIRNNTISGKKTHTWGAALFDIKQETNSFVKDRYIQNKITIENNTIYLNDELFIHGNSIKELNIENNIFLTDNENILLNSKELSMILEHVSIKNIRNNIFKQIDISK